MNKWGISHKQRENEEEEVEMILAHENDLLKENVV